MKNLHNIFFIMIMCSSFVVTAQNHKHMITPAVIVKKVKKAWRSNWVKVGTVTAACATIYALGVKFNFITAAPVLVAVADKLQQNAAQQDSAAIVLPTDDITHDNMQTPQIKEDVVVVEQPVHLAAEQQQENSNASDIQPGTDGSDQTNGTISHSGQTSDASQSLGHGTSDGTDNGEGNSNSNQNDNPELKKNSENNQTEEAPVATQNKFLNLLERIASSMSTDLQ